MTAEAPDILTEKHYEAFGRIIASYAHAESLVKMSIAGLVPVPLSVVMIMSEPYNALALRNVAKSLAKLHDDPELTESMVGLIGRLGSFSSLRNDIAHLRWTNGTRPGSVRPIRLDIRQGRPVHKGFGDDEPDFTIDDLAKKANALFQLYRDIRQFLLDSGLAVAIAKNNALQSASTDLSLGTSATARSSASDETQE